MAMWPWAESALAESDDIAAFPTIQPPSDWRTHFARGLILLVTLAVLGYSFVVVWTVATSGDIGLKCVFGVILKDDVPKDLKWETASPRIGDERTDEYLWSSAPPEKRSTIVSIAGIRTRVYPDYIRALREVRNREGFVSVRWIDPQGIPRQGAVQVARRPIHRTYLSVIWFLQEIVIFAIGAMVYWRRPQDEAARMFFWLCAVTVGAFMGGYHWSEIVVFEGMILPFALFAVFVPIVTLHFFLVFPRPNAFYDRHRRVLVAILYGVPAIGVALIWWSIFDVTSLRGAAAELVQPALDRTRALALAFVAVAVVIFGLCIACLIASYRTARTMVERNQVQWILLASLLSCVPIGFLLFEAAYDAAHLGRDQAAWPMFVVSLLYSTAYAISITRYKLLQAGEIINRSVIYVAASVTAGLIYSAAVFAGAFVLSYGMKANDNGRGREAIVVGVTTIVILALSEAARQWSQRAIDRRFSRDKLRFDQAMKQMSRAVGGLVDRETLARRLLGSAADVLRLEWGAIYLARDADSPLEFVAGHGPEPDEPHLDRSNPLVERLSQQPIVRLAPEAAANDPATDAMFSLGGEVAAALQADGALIGVLVLGPKRNGMPYEEDEAGFLRALASVALMALRSAGIQETLERLNGELRDKVEKIAEQQRRILILQNQLAGRAGETEKTAVPTAPVAPGAFDRIKGSSLAVKQLIDVARKVAPSPSAILIRGESGTGKELIAEAIHLASQRAARPFVKVHCAALSQTLLESELFGHVKGAFTDAARDRVGRFEQADGGTLFLDEIGDINLEVQTKLLRVLQEMTFERVGSSQSIRVDVRILAATHQDLEALIRAGRFREDLFYRLNVIPVRTPSLRERKEDIFPLAVHFLGVHAKKMAKPVTYLDDGAVETLAAHDWPGNVRELENVIERAVVLADGPALTIAELPPEIAQPARRRPRRAATTLLRSASTSREEGRSQASEWAPRVDSSADLLDNDGDLDEEFRAYERRRLIDALQEASGNKSEAARLIGLPRSTFFSKLRKHGLA